MRRKLFPYPQHKRIRAPASYGGPNRLEQDGPPILVFPHWPCSTLLPGPWQRSEPHLACVTGVSPLRGSLRAAPIANRCGWTGVSLSLTLSLRYSLPSAVSRSDGPALHLPWPSFMRVAPHRWSSRIPRCRSPCSSHSTSVNVFRSLDILLSKSSEVEIYPLTSPLHRIPKKRKSF